MERGTFPRVMTPFTVSCKTSHVSLKSTFLGLRDISDQYINLTVLQNDLYLVYLFLELFNIVSQYGLFVRLFHYRQFQCTVLRFAQTKQRRFKT
jgi:hypothetical protein